MKRKDEFAILLHWNSLKSNMIFLYASLMAILLAPLLEPGQTADGEYFYCCWAMW